MHGYDAVESGKPLKRFDRETPQPMGTEVLLRVLGAGVCHSDVHICRSLSAGSLWSERYAAIVKKLLT